MVQWEKWALKRWGFTFTTSQSTEASGQILVFYEPDPDVTYTNSTDNIRLGATHTSKIFSNIWANFSFVCRPPPSDKEQRYCLTEASDNRLVSYGSLYVIYVGGAQYTANTMVYTLEHHQVIDWFKRDIDAASVAGSTPLNEITNTPTSPANLLLGATATPGGLSPTIDSTGTVNVSNTSVGSANNLLLTVTTAMTNNTGVRIPAQTVGTIVGGILDNFETTEFIDPATSSTVVNMVLVNSSVPIKYAASALLTVVSAIAIPWIKIYLSAVPSWITSLDHPEMYKYYPKQLHAMHAKKALSVFSLPPKHERLTGPAQYPVCTAVYQGIDSNALNAKYPRPGSRKINADVVRNQWINTGISPTIIYTNTVPTPPGTLIQSGFEVDIAGPTPGSTIICCLSTLASNYQLQNGSTSDCVGVSGTDYVTYTTTYANGPSNNQKESWVVATVQPTTDDSAPNVSFNWQPVNGTYPVVIAYNDLTITYSQDPASLFEAFKHKIPNLHHNKEKNKLEIVEWKSTALIEMPTFTATNGNQFLYQLLSAAETDGLTFADYGGGTFVGLNGPPLPQMAGYVCLFFSSTGFPALSTTSIAIGNVGTDPQGRVPIVRSMNGFYYFIGYTVDNSDGGWHTPTFTTTDASLTSTSVVLNGFSLSVSSDMVVGFNRLAEHVKQHAPQHAALVAELREEYEQSAPEELEEEDFQPLPPPKVKAVKMIRV